MSLDRRWFVALSAVGLILTPVFLFLLSITAGSECAGPCNRPFWVPYLFGGLFLAGPVSVVVGVIGFLVVGTRRPQQEVGGD